MVLGVARVKALRSLFVVVVCLGVSLDGSERTGSTASLPPVVTTPSTVDLAPPMQPPADLVASRLASEMSRLWTRDPDRLVQVVSAAATQEDTMPVPFLLAIAHAETNGRVLIVSEAGAVGLAQATPIAYLAEGLGGRLYVTEDYVDGSFAYYLKKPLHDADLIASILLEDPEARKGSAARDLLDAAFKYRREGLAELELLTAFSSTDLAKRIEERDARNLAILQEVETAVIDGFDRARLTELRDSARDQYRAMRGLQRTAWVKYQKDLTWRRDELLREKYGVDPKVVMETNAYEAGEYLAEALDDRFSPTKMARFLARHVGTKLAEARELGVAEGEIERMTAGLYNGGGHNIKRMIAGLISQLPETDNYMRKVPSTRWRLESAISDQSR